MPSKYLGIVPRRENVFELEVIPAITTPGNFLYGGAALASSIEAVQQQTSRPVIWMSTQFSSFAAPGDRLEMALEFPAEGRNVTQARVVATNNGKEAFAAFGSFGSRDEPTQGQWGTMPDVEKPGNCRPFPTSGVNVGDNINDHIDMRVAGGWFEAGGEINEQANGRMQMWGRMPDYKDITAPLLALLADFLPASIGPNIGKPAGGSSLDNSLRILQLVPTDWVLVDGQVHGTKNGFGHATANLWAQDGTLLGIASQSFVLRFFEFAEE